MWYLRKVKIALRVYANIKDDAMTKKMVPKHDYIYLIPLTFAFKYGPNKSANFHH